MRSRHAIERTRRSVFLLLGLGLVVGLAGCGGLEPVASYEPSTDPAQLYLRLMLDHRAINLSKVSPYDTLQLTATPLNAAGEPMTGLPAPTFTSSDTTKVWVTPTGLLQARASATNVRVIAELVASGNVRHADTAMINVTTTPPSKLASLSIHSVPPDSGIWAGWNEPDVSTRTKIVPIILRLPAVQVLDSMGNAMTGLRIEYFSLDPSVVTLPANTVTQNTTVTLHRPGQVRVVARTTAYGITAADTAAFTVTWPVGQRVQITTGSDGAPSFLPSEIRLAPYGMAFWVNTLGDSVDVVFDDPTNVVQPPTIICNVYTQFLATYGSGSHCGTGDMLVPPLPPVGQGTLSWTIQARQFPVPGIYPYHSTRTGASGRVIVTADPDPAALP